MIRRLLSSLGTGPTRDTALTGPDAGDPRLAGRTYAIPFDAVWQAALHLVDGKLPGWTFLAADDGEGVIRGEVRGRFRRFDGRFTIRVGLDDDGQTRVDASAVALDGSLDLGVNARRLDRLFRDLDDALDAGRGQPIGGAPLLGPQDGSEPARPSANRLLHTSTDGTKSDR